jgi:hypothetical protein
MEGTSSACWGITHIRASETSVNMLPPAEGARTAEMYFDLARYLAQFTVRAVHYAYVWAGPRVFV